MFEKCVGPIHACRARARERAKGCCTNPDTSRCVMRQCRINKAYEFLVATGKTMTSGPDPQRIILLLRAQVRLRRLALASPPDAKCSRGSRAMSAVQTILFTRYADVLRPYKYSGYPMLIKTIQLETHDDMLFSRYDSTAANVRRLL